MTKNGRKDEVIFRTGSGIVGFGHVRRCLSLAKKLHDFQIQSVFVLDVDDRSQEFVTAAGHEACCIHTDDLQETTEHCIKRSACAIVVDSYAHSPAYFSALKQTGARVAIIDDLADRSLTADLVVNGTAGAENLPYKGDNGTRYLLGPKYILLRPEFAQAPDRVFFDQLRKILITVGGGDPHNLTPRLIRWTSAALPTVLIDVVVGPLFRNIDAVKTATGACGAKLHHAPDEIGKLMTEADLAVCGGGQTTYELAATGTPAVAIRVADNQSLNLTGFASARTLLWVGDAKDADLERHVGAALLDLSASSSLRQELSKNGRALVDGHGADRVARELSNLRAQP